MTVTLTLEQTREMNPPARVIRDMRDNLPDGGTTAYTPSQMAAMGVPHYAIVWAFLHPSALGSSFGAVVCQIAESVLPVFELARPGDTRPMDAIAAARRCFANPTRANRAAALEAAKESFAIAYAAEQFAAYAAAHAARAAADASYAARAAAVYTAEWAVAAGCPPATVLSLIEEAGQTAPKRPV
ncbi:MAG: hypothetical protein GY767_06570 [Shimia sp.]|nr:hypothetical protein [Shimia sp.]